MEEYAEMLKGDMNRGRWDDGVRFIGAVRKYLFL